MTDLELKKLEEDLWHSADLLRAGAHMSATNYGEPILGLIFLRYADIRPHCIDDAAVAGQHLVLDLRDCPADGAAGRGRDLIHGGVHQRVGRRAVFLVVFQIK